MTRIAVALFDGAEELDWAGPWEVLSAWAQQWPDDGVEVFTVARADGVVTSAKGLRVVPDRTWDDAGEIDVLVYPGGMGTRRELRDDAVLEWIRELRRRETLMTSVCTGSLVYAAAGLLADRPATTWSRPHRATRTRRSPVRVWASGAPSASSGSRSSRSRSSPRS